MKKQLNYFFQGCMILLTGAIWLCSADFLIAQEINIKNDQFWETVDGEPIYSQGGGVFQFTDPVTGSKKYYWYGAFYEEAELYRNNPAVTQKTDNFVAVTCYTSTDLVNWSFEDHVLEMAEIDQHFDNTSWMGRLGVAYIKEIDQYAMFIQHVSQLLILLSDSPTGPFKWHHRKNMEPIIGTTNTGDQTVFTDEDTGISYLVYSHGRGRARIYISEIGVKNGKVDLLDSKEVFKGEGREGNTMVKYKGKYYLFASNLYGWDSSYAYYLVADDVRGPYRPTNKMLITPGSMDDYAHITQTGFFITVKGSEQETVIYCGDRWANFAGNGLGYNQWMPMSFDGLTPHFNSLNSWDFDVNTGAWKVADDNNYIKNGSFEADRKYIPSDVKPLQEQLKGWLSKVYQGNDIVIGASDSPVLNFYNTREDRKIVIGEKSLNISDVIRFKRKVYQVIESTPFVPLKDGNYILTAKVKCSKNFHELEMYAESNGERTSVKIEDKNAGWTQVELKDIKVKGGKVVVGFWADGGAGASCQIDDVAFIMGDTNQWLEN
ncbi:MAG: family 43 glycosylhydrolase [Bacteroidales bacterium]